MVAVHLKLCPVFLAFITPPQFDVDVQHQIGWNVILNEIEIIIITYHLQQMLVSLAIVSLQVSSQL